MSAGATVAVVNPASAGGRTRERWPEIARAMRRAGVEFEERVTGAPGEATAAVRAALRAGAARIVAVGGDGTVNEVVNGFFDDGGAPLGPDAVLGIVPRGTGADLRRTLAIPTGVEEAVALLARGASRRIDVGRVEWGPPGAGVAPRMFLNIADCGVGGEVVARVNRSRRKGRGGTPVFLYHSLAVLLGYRATRLRIEADGAVVEERVRSLVVANGRCFGGGMRIAPDARVDDGLFDVVVIGDLTRAAAVRGVPALYRGRHVGRPGVRVLRARSVEVVPLEEPAPLFDLDGEQVGAAPARITCLPGALRVCAAES